MNPFAGTLNRLGFLFWSILLIAWVIGFGLLIDATKAHHIGVYWLSERIIWGIILIFFSILVSVRRIQNAGLSNWFIVLSLIPYLGFVFWFILFLLPPKSKGQQPIAQM
jgi:uncharacterized membrane protein YhaH (DUF805 family)